MLTTRHVRDTTACGMRLLLCSRTELLAGKTCSRQDMRVTRHFRDQHRNHLGRDMAHGLVERWGATSVKRRRPQQNTPAKERGDEERAPLPTMLFRSQEQMSASQNRHLRKVCTQVEAGWVGLAWFASASLAHHCSKALGAKTTGPG